MNATSDQWPMLMYPRGLNVIAGHMFKSSIKCLVASDLSESLYVRSLRLSGYNLFNFDGKYIF